MSFRFENIWIQHIVIVQMFLTFKKGLSRLLQERSLDIGRALKSVTLVQSSLDCRANVEQFNHQCFEMSASICEPLDIEDKKKLEYAGDKQWDNVEAESPEDYIRKSITVPFLDYMLNEMKTRFTDLHGRTALGLQLVPSIIENIAPYLSPAVNRVSGSAPVVHHIELFNILSPVCVFFLYFICFTFDQKSGILLLF